MMKSLSKTASRISEFCQYAIIDVLSPISLTSLFVFVVCAAVASIGNYPRILSIYGEQGFSVVSNITHNTVKSRFADCLDMTKPMYFVEKDGRLLVSTLDAESGEIDLCVNEDVVAAQALEQELTTQDADATVVIPIQGVPLVF